MEDNLYTGDEARQGLVRGVKKVAEAVGRTMGTSGHNSLIETIEDPGHFPTNDGYQIANAVKLADPLEEMGHRILLESVNRANRASGDGSSTTCVITAKLLEMGLAEEKDQQTPPMEIMRSLERLVPEIEEKIKAQSKKISISEVKDVASTSAESEQIGERIQEIYGQIGEKGVIHYEAGKLPEDTYEITTGLKVEGATYASRYMCDVSDSGQIQTTVRAKDVPVILYRDKLTSSNGFDHILQSFFEEGKETVAIFCDDIEAIAVNDLVRTRQMYAQRGRKFVIVAIKMPVIFNDEWWEDLASATGAVIVGKHPTAGISLRNLQRHHAGVVGNLVVDKEDAYLDGFSEEARLRLGELVASLRLAGDDGSLLRAERLNTTTARYFVGGYSPNAIAYRRMKVEDAINAAACALEDGIVVGGGIALLNVAREIEKSKTAAHKLVAEALREPFRRIVTNAGYDAREKEAECGGEEGFNSKTGNKANLVKAGIVDATPVVLNAVKNAIGTAAAILTNGNVILLPRDEKPPAMPPITPIVR